jgi:hypothetical protein
VTGRAWIEGRGEEIVTLKLRAADGEIDWSDLYGGGLDDRAWDVIVGPDGHPVVTGLSANADGTADYLTIKYDSESGAHIWSRSLPGAVNNQTRAGWLAVTGEGDVLLCNRTWLPTSSYDVVLHRYAAASGDTLWTRRYDGPSGGADDPRCMIADPAGDLIVAGVRSGDYLVLKLSPVDGHEIWSATYDGPPGWYDVAACAATGPDGEVIVSGFSDGTTTGWDVATVAFDAADGSQLWDVRYDGDGQSDEARAVVCGTDGDLFVVGYAYSNTTNMDILSLRYLLDDLSGTPEDLPVVARRLVSAHPNPFNPRLLIDLQLPVSQAVRLDIHDVAGRRLRTLQSGPLPAGRQELTWDGCDDSGRPAPAGTYLLRLSGGSWHESRKVVLVR